MSVVAEMRKELERRGEYVARANASSGWFAVNVKTWQVRSEQATLEGRRGPNLIVFRTISEDPRDHYVVPPQISETLLIPETLKKQRNGAYRWNLTLKDGRLHVSHLAGSVDVSEFKGLTLIVESYERPSPSEGDRSQFLGASASVIEGISRETKFVARSRSRSLRDAALEVSKGFCEACGIDFSNVLGGLGSRALQVHHKRQLALSESPVETRLEDLAVVCANCHAMIHSDPKAALPVEELQRLWVASREIG